MEPELSPISSDFLARWDIWYPDAPPIGFLLREEYEDRWLRIHSLPEGKRNATSDQEYDEILRRHNRVATDVLGAHAACVLLLGPHPTERGVTHLAEQCRFPESGFGDAGPLSPKLWDADEGFYGVPMSLSGSRTVWLEGAFDRFILEVAEDRVRGLFVADDGWQVYAPYEGGADLIFATTFERDLARERYAAWLSAHPSGL